MSAVCSVLIVVLWQALAPLLTDAKTPSDAVRAIVAAIPSLQLQGVLATSAGTLLPGPPITWHSSTSPGFLSAQQVIAHGGSCTGTGILLAVACRAVGVAARLAGCSESVVAGDDHHWVEYWDGGAAGPFGDAWHTKEGVSLGNEGGPWDEPSQPMGGCLQGVTPHARLRTIWASAWSGTRFLPLLWAQDDFAERRGWVGGENRCGAYCGAWGCGQTRDQHYTQAQCG